MRRLFLFCLASAGLASAARATVLDFEGLPLWSTDEGLLAEIPNGYGGFQWDPFFFVMDAATYFVNPSGYLNGLVSGKNVAYNAFVNDVSFWVASGTFALKGLYLTAAWNDGLNVDITGYLGNSAVHTATVVVNANAPTHVLLNWSGVDKVEFHSYGGVNAGYGGYGTQFALDDLDVEVKGAPVPEPFTVALGLGGLALAARRRRR
jgi:MYXO-CTERM domain-containing protein